MINAIFQLKGAYLVDRRGRATGIRSHVQRWDLSGCTLQPASSPWSSSWELGTSESCILSGCNFQKVFGLPQISLVRSRSRCVLLWEGAWFPMQNVNISISEFFNGCIIVFILPSVSGILQYNLQPFYVSYRKKTGTCFISPFSFLIMPLIENN